MRYIHKFLARAVPMRPLEEEGSAGGSGGDFDIQAAMDDIADGLGFNTSEVEDAGDKTTAVDGDAGDVSPAVDASAASADAADKPAGEAEGAVADKPADAPAGPAAPRTWRAEAAAKWAELPPEVQAEIVKREDDMFKGIEGYKADATQGKAFSQSLAPYAARIQRDGVDPVNLSSELMAVHFVLKDGTPEQKQGLAKQLLSHYGVQLPSQADDLSPFVDPEVKALQQELAAVKSQLSGTAQQAQAVAQAREAEIRSKLQAEVDAFAADPANTHFQEVAGMIPQLLQAGVAKDLKSAYEHAVMLNPVTREKEIARRTAETAQKQAAEAAAKAEAARKAAAANVKTTAKNAGGTAPLGSIDDTLQAAYRQLMSKGE